MAFVRMSEWHVMTLTQQAVNEWHARSNGHVVSMSEWQVIIEWHAMSDGHVVSSLNPPRAPLPSEMVCF